MLSQYRPVAPVGGASPSAYHSRREVLDWRRQHRSGGSLPGSRDGVAPRQPLQPRLRDPVDPVLLGQHARRRVSTRRRTMRLSRSLRPVSPAPGLGLDLERSGGAPGRNRTCCLMLRRHALSPMSYRRPATEVYGPRLTECARPRSQSPALSAADRCRPQRTAPRSDVAATDQ